MLDLKTSTLYKSAVILRQSSLLTNSFISILKESSLFETIYECRRKEELQELIKTEKAEHLFIGDNFIDNEFLSFIPETLSLHKGIFFIITSSSKNTANTALVFKTRKAGACAFILQKTNINEIKACLQTIHANTYYISLTIFNTLLKLHLNEKNVFTPQEQEVLQQLIARKSIAEISVNLKIKQHTVIWHSRKMMKKAGVDSITRLIKKAITDGLV